MHHGPRATDYSPIMAMYFLANAGVATVGWRSCRLRLPVLWLFRCFLPAWLRLSLPVPVILNRFLDALCVFCFGMTHHLVVSGGLTPPVVVGIGGSRSPLAK